jgi:hypothetical protein
MQDPPVEPKGQPRIAVLVLGCLLPVYDRCIRTIRATWAARPVEGVDVFYVYGAQPARTGQELVDVEALIGGPRPHLEDGEVWVSGDIILCGAADVFDRQRNCILRKRLIAFGYLAGRGYDFVYNVCASSYVDLAGLSRYARHLQPSGIYQGPLSVHGPTGYPFVSGASMLLSRDLAAELAARMGSILSEYPEDLPDDVTIGHWIASRYCHEPLDEICRRLEADTRATDNQTFVEPHGRKIMDYVDAPAFAQVPHELSYHYHFHSRRVWDMENFHRRFFAVA